MNRGYFWNDQYGNTSLHVTAIPRRTGLQGLYNPAAPVSSRHTEHTVPSVTLLNPWARYHEDLEDPGPGGLYGYNMSAKFDWYTGGDVEAFSFPYAPNHVQCRYDQSEGVCYSCSCRLQCLPRWLPPTCVPKTLARVDSTLQCEGGSIACQRITRGACVRHAARQRHMPSVALRSSMIA
jgi:hypothetical protein